MSFSPKKTLGRVASRAALGFTDFLGISPLPGKNILVFLLNYFLNIFTFRN